MLARSARFTGCLPELDVSLMWLPVDRCACAIVEIATRKDCADRRAGVDAVVHLANTHGRTWSDWLAALKRAGLRFEVVPPGEWLDRLDQSEADPNVNPSRKLLSLWKRSYGTASSARPPIVAISRASHFTSIGEVGALTDDVLDVLASHCTEI